MGHEGELGLCFEYCSKEAPGENSPQEEKGLGTVSVMQRQSLGLLQRS